MQQYKEWQQLEGLKGNFKLVTHLVKWPKYLELLTLFE